MVIVYSQWEEVAGYCSYFGLQPLLRVGESLQAMGLGYGRPYQAATARGFFWDATVGLAQVNYSFGAVTC